MKKRKPISIGDLFIYGPRNQRLLDIGFNPLFIVWDQHNERPFEWTLYDLKTETTSWEYESILFDSHRYRRVA